MTTDSNTSTNNHVEIHAYKKISNWLFLGAFLVAVIVITGGITRLTHSGLSMVTWEPVSGILPPLNDVDWQAEFNNYKESPEFNLKNRNFNLEDFKGIFWWEYIHRVFARMIGLVFIFPFLFFLFKGYLKNKKLIKHLIIIFILGGFQGFLGWFMVASGLVEKPEVSHYRLAAHLLTALTLFSYILWIGLHLRFNKLEFKTNKSLQIRPFLWVNIILLIIQIAYGAFMAGLKAGFFFPTFPKMGANWIPQNLSEVFEQEGLLSLFNNPFLVQFIHRWIPLFIFLIGVYLWVKIEKTSLFSHQKWIIRSMNFMILLQIILGVYTILFSVPVHLGVLHQFGAVILLALSLIAMFFFRKRNIFEQQNV